MTRDEKGRYIKGHEPTGGRKSKAVEERYLEAFKAAVKPEDITDIVAKALDQAKHGDAEARKFIFGYAIGMPVQRNEVSGPDGEPVQMDILYVLSKLIPPTPES